MIFQNCLKFHELLRITILKYHSCYLCQISLQIMLLPIQILAYCVKSNSLKTLKSPANAPHFPDVGVRGFPLTSALYISISLWWWIFFYQLHHSNYIFGLNTICLFTSSKQYTNRELRYETLRVQINWIHWQQQIGCCKSHMLHLKAICYITRLDFNKKC